MLKIRNENSRTMEDGDHINVDKSGMRGGFDTELLSASSEWVDVIFICSEEHQAAAR